MDIRKLNSLTKYPSIPTFHDLGPRQRLLETHLALPDQTLLFTEKVDGANARMVFVDGTYFIGMRKEFGEDIDPKKVCKMTCDYCVNPQKVSDAMSTSQDRSNVSRAIRDVKQQNFGGFMKFHNSLHASDIEEEEDYVKGRVTNYWKGIVNLYNYDYGRFDIDTVAMGRLAREYSKA
jgi:hypothetical protein